MNLESLSPKQLNELEHMVRELLAALRKAKLHQEPLAEALRKAEEELGALRRERFDSQNPYPGY